MKICIISEPWKLPTEHYGGTQRIYLRSGDYGKARCSESLTAARWLHGDSWVGRSFVGALHASFWIWEGGWACRSLEQNSRCLWRFPQKAKEIFCTLRGDVIPHLVFPALGVSLSRVITFNMCAHLEPCDPKVRKYLSAWAFDLLTLVRATSLPTVLQPPDLYCHRR